VKCKNRKFHSSELSFRTSSDTILVCSGGGGGAGAGGVYVFDTLTVTLVGR